MKVSETCSSNSNEFNNEFDNIEDGNTKTCSSNGDKFNDEFEDRDIEISIVRDEDMNNIITKLLQAVPEQKAAIITSKLESFWTPVISADMNNNIIDSDSNSENEFEVEIDKGHNMSPEMLGNIIKQLEKKVKNNKHGEAIFSNLLSEACVTTYPGKDSNKWWNLDNLVNQVVNYAIPIFEDALLAKRINLFSSKNQPKMSTTYRDNIPQDMCFPEDYDDPNLYSKPKGLKKVLSERGLWHFRAQYRKVEEAIVLVGYK
ncbi:23419_t:CDS:2, partial [Racocetra persica]